MRDWSKPHLPQPLRRICARLILSKAYHILPFRVRMWAHLNRRQEDQ